LLLLTDIVMFLFDIMDVYHFFSSISCMLTF